MRKPGLTIKLACGLCAALVLLFAALALVLPQGRTPLSLLVGVFFLLLSLNVHALPRGEK